jgi:hypothetical protein
MDAREQRGKRKKIRRLEGRVRGVVYKDVHRTRQLT